MLCLVTGAAGFIGSHLVELLVREGLTVRSMVQEGGTTENLTGVSTGIIFGDVKRPESLRAAMKGVERVYHLAAIPRHDARVPAAEYRAVNVEGTRNVLEAARLEGVRRVVITSSIEAVGPSPDGRALTEATPPNPRNIYGESKLAMEELVRAYHGQHGLDALVVRPPMIYGPRDLILLKRLFRIIRRGVYPLVGDGQALTEFCFVRNQVHGIHRVAQQGRAGEIYFISAERSFPIETIIRAIAAGMGCRVITPHMPVPVALALGGTLEVLSKIFRFYPFLIPQTGRPPFSRKTVVWTSQSRLYCDIGKARQELGYEPPFTLEEGIRETVKWYRDRNLLQ